MKHISTVWDNFDLYGSLNFPTGQGSKTLTCRELYTSHPFKVKLKLNITHINQDMPSKSLNTYQEHMEKDPLEVVLPYSTNRFLSTTNMTGKR